MASSNSKANNVEVPGYLKFSKFIVWFLYFWVMIGVISLTLRVFLLALSASAESSFVQFVYDVSSDYLQPFRGIWPPKPVGETGYLDVAAIFAIIVYLFIAWGFKALIEYIQHKIDKNVAEQESQLRKRSVN